MSKKKQVIEALFKECFSNKDMQFSNAAVKKESSKVGFRNPFDATKIDNSELLPVALLNENYFIAHLGQGDHKFVKGINNWYHKFEDIPEENKKDWTYKKSILNELDTSESNILSLVYNQRIIHDFLYDDIIANPKIYNSHRTKYSFSYKAGETLIQANKLQMELDMTLELNGTVTIFEAKNNFSKDFAIYQIFHPFLYYRLMNEKHNLNIQEINCCYILKEKFDRYTKIRMYLYTFINQSIISSIKLIKCKEYNLTKK